VHIVQQRSCRLFEEGLRGDSLCNFETVTLIGEQRSELCQQVGLVDKGEALRVILLEVDQLLDSCATGLNREDELILGEAAHHR